jgi:hypothetical protein
VQDAYASGITPGRHILLEVIYQHIGLSLCDSVSLFVTGEYGTIAGARVVPIQPGEFAADAGFLVATQRGTQHSEFNVVIPEPSQQGSETGQHRQGGEEPFHEFRTAIAEFLYAGFTGGFVTDVFISFFAKQSSPG